MSSDKQRIDFITNDINDHDDVDDLWNLPTTLLNSKIPSSLTSSSPSSGSSGTMSKLNSLDCWDYTIELECLQGPQDLQLAAELGKNLLVRNKELETDLRNSQNIIDEQAQEIEYLQKQTAALREVTNSRCRIYEHMEVGIQDLERANHRLKVENASDKKSIKSIMNTNEALETRNDELVKNLEETNKLLALERRRNERLSSDRNYDKVDGGILRSRQDNNYPNNHDVDNVDGGFDPTATAGTANYSFEFQLSDNKSSSLKSTNNANSTQISDNLNDDNNISHIENEEIIRFVEELEKNKKDLQMEQQKNIELEEQIITLIQENQSLQDKISQTSLQEEMKSVHDELSILDDVRQGRMCTRCLRSVDDRTTNLDENSSIAPTEDDDDVGSLMDLEQDTQLYRSALTIKNLQKPNMLDLHADCPSPNPYRDLVEKYEALMEVQRHSLPSLHRKSLTNNCNNGGGVGISLSEEFQLSGEFNTLNMIQQSKIINGQEQQEDDNNTLDVDNKSTTSTNNIVVSGGSDGGNSNNNIDNSSLRRTPTEFSEAGTSSSGFSDVTSNKSTQTDDRPGYFLCSIGDGEDCKFSIYDDASPIDSRFRQRPEYRELFKEIFEVLRKAAEKKAEGEKLPLLDDDTNIQQQQQHQLQQHYQNKVPPVTPANEELPLLLDFCGDDTQSIISSVMSEQSVAMSECITKVERKIAKKHIIEKNQENKPPTIGNSMLSINNDTTTTGSTATINSITTTTPNNGNNGKQRQQIIENGRILTPLKREPLEYLTVGVGIKKKNRKKNRNNFNNSSDRSDSPILPSPPRIYFGGGSGKKRRDMRPLNESPLAATSSSQQQQQQSNTTTPTRGWSPRANGTMTHEWNGNSMIIYNRNHNTPTTATTTGKNGKILDMSSVQYRRTVSQDLHILKKLDLSYAEVLRRTDPCKHHRRK